MNSWCCFLNCSTGLATRDCKVSHSVQAQSIRQWQGYQSHIKLDFQGRAPQQGCATASAPVSWTNSGPSCDCLMVSYISPQSSCFTFLTYHIFFLFPSSLAMLDIYRSFTSLFFSFVYSVILLFAIFPPEATCFVLSFQHTHLERAAQLRELSTCPCAAKEKRGME